MNSITLGFCDDEWRDAVPGLKSRAKARHLKMRHLFWCVLHSPTLPGITE
jgi:hypothetical protein